MRAAKDEWGFTLHLVPPELKLIPQWVCWRMVDSSKVPVRPDTGHRVSVTDPASWTDFDAAEAAMAEDGRDGVGFVFTEGDPYVGIDMDKCLDPDTGELEPWAYEVVSALPQAYVERSPSLTGLHVIIRGVLPERRHRLGNLEIYDSDRFFTVTGWKV